MSSIVLEAKGIHKRFYKPQKVEILRGIDLTIHRGQAVAITGRSGQGKSTLLQLLGTLEPACEGTLTILQQQVSWYNKSKIRNKQIAFIFQSFHLLEDYTALENILMPAWIGRNPVSLNSPLHQRALRLLDEVGLAERANFPVKLLSGGEKQRVAFARAALNDPDIIFADEPSGNLDKQTAEVIHRFLLDYRKKGKSIVIVTHDPLLANLCDQQYILHEGKLDIGIQTEHKQS